jgi:Ca2+-binding EF-hand superfamily protein
MKTALAILGVTFALTTWAQTPDKTPNQPRQTAEESFTQLDTNKDGQLSLAEFKAGRDAMHGAHMRHMHVRHMDEMFKQRDADHDGFLSKSELGKSRLADRFDQIDANKDGKLSMDELKAAHEKMGPRKGPDMDKGVAPGQPKVNPTSGT